MRWSVLAAAGAVGVPLAFFGYAMSVSEARAPKPAGPIYRSVAVSLRVDEGSIPQLCRKLCSTGRGTTSSLDEIPGDPGYRPITRRGASAEALDSAWRAP